MLFFPRARSRRLFVAAGVVRQLAPDDDLESVVVLLDSNVHFFVVVRVLLVVFLLLASAPAAAERRGGGRRDGHLGEAWSEGGMGRVEGRGGVLRGPALRRGGLGRSPAKTHRRLRRASCETSASSSTTLICGWSARRQIASSKQEASHRSPLLLRFSRRPTSSF